MPRRRRPPRPGALADLAPLRILTQIALLQVLYYACAAVLILFTALVAGKELSLDLLLSWRSLRGDITVGWMLGLVWMLNSLICVVFLLLFIARSKLIPDFACTIHFLHLVVTSFYSHSIPTNLFWWALQIASASLMTFLGIWACQWRELKPINFGGGGGPNRAARANAVAAGAQEDEGIGFGRGRGRGRGRDGGGEYEMVGMKEGDANV
ncbi:hypothetical protein W97_08173 [Coniosporium apollinis CBS 100218]|uniref:Protein SYS1 n=1 Tax=Coniosporium apollinis (strain CBS 100218) TaxID=1168221 RepID=R7Z3Z1_CONA1|nr:uncharacterized protein W97_08173 [Coniosporium apollinis CBS 100218]EON68915.1 hypothetical protein W97_08173 [Coniosporium apollinis CBS 100218]